MSAKLISVAKRSWIYGVMAFIMSLGAPASQAQQASSADPPGHAAMKFGSISRVIAKWSADQHVYVHGDIGVGKTQLAELEEWLDNHGTHWTVVLMQDAEGQRFTTSDGRKHTGMDAVEYALGHGLSNRTDFGKLEHPISHEADGTVFVLFLRERKFSYFASQAQDCRELGEAQWVGELDQPALRAMQSGARIIDAVKDTVTSINGKLEQAIQAEKAAEPSSKER